MPPVVEIVSPSELVKNTGFAHTAACVGKTPIVINSRVVIPLNTTQAGERNAFVYETELANCPKAAGQAWAYGAALYWDATNAVFTTTATNNTACGYAVQPAASADTVSGLIAFNTFV